MRKIKVNLDKVKASCKKERENGRKEEDLSGTILAACSVCHKIKVGFDDQGNEIYREISPELYYRLPGLGGLSHGLCTPCYESTYGEELRNKGISYERIINYGEEKNE